MGVVFEAVHRTQRLPVAIKVLTHDATRHESFLRAFAHEIRTTAALTHPCIIEVYDHSTVPKAVDGVFGLRAGDPFLAMEWVAGGSLESAAGAIRWPVLREVFRQVLDALAHAHARGVIHRDLKPGNVLQTNGLLALKLTDFGIAHLHRGGRSRTLGDEGKGASGTPDYMAPEQIADDWRAFGPTLDLYSLGCMGWELATGLAPFEAPSTTETLAGHLYRAPPEFVPKFPVPPGLETWLRRLLEKEPGHRFQRAADAAWAMLQLVPSRTTAEHSGALAGPPEASLLPPTLAWSEQELMTERPTQPDGLAALPFDGGPPPAPVQWRRVEVLTASSRPAGAGIGLLGLRAVPMVGRDQERDVLWDALRDVARENRARAIVLTGVTGLGKTRLTSWLSETSHELGVATTLSARFTADGDAGATLWSTLEDLYCTRDLSREETTEQLTRMGACQPTRLAELLVGRSVELPTSARERSAAIRREIENLARTRPVVVVLDEVHNAPSALEFATHFIDAQYFSPSAALLVLTLDEEHLAGDGELSQRLRDLLLLPGTERLRIEPLAPALRPLLVRSILGLSDDLTAAVVGRTGGNPAFALAVVTGWAERGLLVPDVHGYRLVEGESARVDELPVSLYSAWEAHLTRLLSGPLRESGAALEVGAALGAQFDFRTFGEVCRRAGITVQNGLFEALVERRLARFVFQGDQVVGLVFAHALLVVALEQRALAAGRFVAIHSACADVYALRPHGTVCEDQGRHLGAAQRYGEALAPLAAAVVHHLNSGEFWLASSLLDRHDLCARRASLHEDDPTFFDGLLLRARLARCRGQFLDGDALAARAETAAGLRSWPTLLARSLLERGRLAWHLGEPALAMERLISAEQKAKALGDTRLQAECDWQIGDLELGLGRLESAAWFLEAARKVFAEAHDLVNAGKACLSLGEVARQSGDLAAAVAHLVAARDFLVAGRAQWGTAECENKLGEVARMRGDLGVADHHYREAMQQYRSLGSGMAIYPELNLGLVCVEAGRFLEAVPVLEAMLRHFTQQGTRAMVGALHVCLMACAAGQGDPQAFDFHADEGERQLQSSSFVDVDNARMSEVAGEAARAHGDLSRARRAFALAAAQWEALGRTRDAARVRAEAAGT